MNEFEVIVIGAGPSGGYAALAAASRGCRVALFEEHGAIGWPRHDPGWLMESDFARSLVGSLSAVIPPTKVKEYRVLDPEAGSPIEVMSRAGYMVRRDLMEKEIAALAVKAGAHLYLRAKVTGFIRREGKVVGIETNSEVIPSATAEIFICADGIRSAATGLAASEGLCEKKEQRPGMSYLLANAGVSAGVVEHFVSPDPDLDYKAFWPHHQGVCYIGMSSPSAFQKLKAREDNEVSRKIRNAYPLEENGYSARVFKGKGNKYWPGIVRDNLLFIGDASGGAGNVHGMIQGQFAGTVAANATREHDTGEKRLAEYESLVTMTLAKAPFAYHTARADFGSFSNWFRAVEEATRGITAQLSSKGRTD